MTAVEDQGAVVAGRRMAAEIAEQPAVLQRLVDEGRPCISTTRAAILDRAPRFVLIAARGTSDHAAVYAKYLVETHLGLPAGLVSPSAFTLYGARPDMRDVLFLAVSQSGGSPDLVDTTRRAAEAGATTVAVTNTAGSPLAGVAAHHVDVLAGPETAVAATKTYTAELLALYLLISGLHPGGVAEAAAATLSVVDAAEAAADRYRYVDRIVTTGRGFSYPTALEAALKLMETSYISAQAFSAADLMHGPFAMMGSRLPVIAVTTPGIAGHSMGSVVDRLRAIGADVLCVGGPGGLRVASDAVADALAPLLEILPLQVLAWRLALVRGEDPDRPRGLLKVTETW